jgi:N6-L-threonylcarbamoyladenine synthase
MLVYVLNKNKEPLMPCKPAKARKLLKMNKAKVIQKKPFTIQLLYGSSGYKQEISLGVDTGSKFIGLSATTEKKELYASTVELRNDIVKLNSDRKQYRKNRRSRNTRYRKPRFNNRKKGKNWISPSIKHKIDTHLKSIDNVYKILPISKLIVELASFDIQKIKNPNISGVEYQHGEQLGFLNLKQYILHRDHYTCQYCKGKSKHHVLNIHHIESRKTGGDSPDNLITLCKTCHTKFHNGEIQLNIKRKLSFRDASFMNFMKWRLFNKLKELYSNVSMTFGYITNHIRTKYGLPKEHYVDARCISGNPTAEPLDYYFYLKKVRCHNRQIHKANPKKGKRQLKQAPYIVKGFRLYDNVDYDGQKCFIWGRRRSGYFLLKKLDGTVIHNSASYKKIKLLLPRRSYLIETRRVVTS